MQAEFIPLSQRHHGADDQHAAGAMVEMRSGPDVAPGIAGDQVLEVGVERVAVFDRLVDPLIAKHLAALGHAVVAALVVVHRYLPPSLRAKRSNPCRCSGIEWIASSLCSLAQ